ncbi:uncharacterized protein LOC116294301 [Actinia tenebrosa]|uniref:Uncharacterized protein LOC116294301 n=1 Tax=Actinia tenebrosa TaxID=6105 RepID=A0A6P8HQ74_ACTTE|nr:uncharacterized protein LOC116294301 [Actinia tenebrosa]
MREENRNWRLEKNRRKNQQEPNNRNAGIDRRSNGSETLEQQNIDIHGGERPNQPTEHDEEPIANDNAPANSSTSSVNANSFNGDFNAIQRQPNIPVEHDETDPLPGYTTKGHRVMQPEDESNH